MKPWQHTLDLFIDLTALRPMLSSILDVFWDMDKPLANQRFQVF